MNREKLIETLKNLVWIAFGISAVILLLPLVGVGVIVGLLFLAGFVGYIFIYGVIKTLEEKFNKK